MKLTYSNTNNFMNQVSITLLICWLFSLIILHITMIEETISVIFIIMEFLTIIGIILQIYSMKKEKNIIKNELWKNGEKCVGYITEVGYIRYTRKEVFIAVDSVSEKIPYTNQNIDHYILAHYITVTYNNSCTIDIKSIEYNQAYKLLGMLLNPYPVKEKIQIPIDIYIYKNKVYADLNSVDLSKIKGYEEYKKLIEE